MADGGQRSWAMLEAISHSNSKESSSKEVEADEAKTVDVTGPKINLSEGVAHEQLEKVTFKYVHSACIF